MNNIRHIQNEETTVEIFRISDEKSQRKINPMNDPLFFIFYYSISIKHVCVYIIF